MKSITNTQQELNTLKNDVIGLFKIKDSFELVLQVYETTFRTIRITQFGVIQESLYNFDYVRGNFKLFPDNKNMNQMLDNPFEFDAFIKSFSV